MSETAYHLMIGKYKCIIFSDGCLIDKRPEGTVTFGLNFIYIEADSRKLLVDTGCGRLFQATAGQLIQNMQKVGIKCEDIDTIIFSHGHIDHVCGTFDLTGKPTFPNARYIISRKEWGYIEAPPGNNEIQNTFFEPARKFLIPLKDRFDLVEDNYEILPGIKMKPAHGHTPGNTMIDISSNGERLLCIGDIIHSPHEFEDPEYLTAFDVTPEEAVKTRAQVLTKLAKDGTFVFAGHFTFPGLGYIRQKKGVFSWGPI
ncbi:MAG: MBL fold metallo-hydrolase [Deltaproteobacteria bacterium]|nr:MBL fold metallo-hydrolase [Deltaproteobacteria bacterium]